MSLKNTGGKRQYREKSTLSLFYFVTCHKLAIYTLPNYVNRCQLLSISRKSPEWHIKVEMLKVFNTASFCQVFMWNKFRMAVFYYFFWWIMKWSTAFKTISHFERTRYFFSTKFQQPGPRFIDLAWSKEWGNHGVSENVWIQKSYIWIEFMNSVRQKDLPSAVIYDFWISNKVENANWR